MPPLTPSPPHYRLDRPVANPVRPSAVSARLTMVKLYGLDLVPMLSALAMKVAIFVHVLQLQMLLVLLRAPGLRTPCDCLLKGFCQSTLQMYLAGIPAKLWTFCLLTTAPAPEQFSKKVIPQA